MKPRICGVCGTEWTPANTGAAKRKDKCCDSCYPRYRKAVNLLASAQYRANQRGVEFSLSLSDINERLKHPCPRTGVEFVLGSTGRNYKDRHPFTPSIDRINPDRGYVPDNIQVVCWWYNLSKALFTDEEVLILCQKVVDSCTMPIALSAEEKTS